MQKQTLGLLSKEETAEYNELQRIRLESVTAGKSRELSDAEKEELQKLQVRCLTER